MRNSEQDSAPFFVPIFFLSGSAGLAYQIVWTKGLAAGIGHEFPAMLAVVTAFMTGMSFGSAAFSRKAQIDPRWYAWLETIIGLWGIVTAILLPGFGRVVNGLVGLETSPATQWLTVFLSVLLFLFPATTAMGATLPAAERFLFCRVERHTTGLLYAANTAGAAAGAVLAAFWLMPAFGIGGALLGLGAVNLLCGGAALWLARGATPGTHRVVKGGGLALFQIAVLGFLGLGLEVAVVRALSHVLENTVFTFAVVLAVYLLGNAIGAALFHRWQERCLSRSGDLLAGLGIVCVVGAILLRWMPGLYRELRSAFGDTLAMVGLAEFLTALAIFLLPSMLMGAVFAAVAQKTLRFYRSLAWSVAANLAGGAIAPVVFGLVLIPGIGLKAAFAIIAAGYVGLAWISDGKEATPQKLYRNFAGSPTIAAIVVLIAIPFICSTQELIEENDAKIVSFREGVMGSVAVLESRNGARVLKFNNRFQMGGTAARIAEERQADIPLLLHPEPARALFIGLGTGITFAAAAQHPGLAADGVELVPEIAQAIPLFVSGRPNLALRVHVADGRRFVHKSAKQYDVIVGDLFHPGQDGAGFLYTREHFAAVRARLSANGLFCQWLPLHQMDLPTAKTVMRTFDEVFPGAEVWLLRFSIDTPVIGLVGYASPPSFSAEWVEKRESVSNHLQQVGLGDSVRLFGCYIGRIPEWTDVELNTDMNPVVMFRAPAITFRRKDKPGERLLEILAMCRTDIGQLNWDRAEELIEKTRAFIRSRDIYLGGMVQEKNGNVRAAIGAYIESARISNDFTAGYAQALTLATILSNEKPDLAKHILEALFDAQPNRPVARELLERLQR